MIIVKHAAALSKYVSLFKNRGRKIGFVPTMGALHAGHISLIAQSVGRGNITVCSIFVNPTQFNDAGDLQKYPVTIEKDILLLERNGCDLLFLPSVEEVYPQGTTLPQAYALGELENLLEGHYRPGHFQGVSQVVERLLRLVQPDELFMGQKDLQQTMIVKKMMQLSGLDIPMITGQTLRESSGLAMSSRNERLTADSRQKAAVVQAMLLFAKEHLHEMELAAISAHAQRAILDAGFEKIDYFSFHDAETLEPVILWDGQQKLVALFAGYIDGVRLIDNMPLN